MPYYRILLSSDITSEIYQDQDGNYEAVLTIPSGLTTYLIIKKEFPSFDQAHEWTVSIHKDLLHSALLLHT